MFDITNLGNNTPLSSFASQSSVIVNVTLIRAILVKCFVKSYYILQSCIKKLQGYKESEKKSEDIYKDVCNFAVNEAICLFERAVLFLLK